MSLRQKPKKAEDALVPYTKIRQGCCGFCKESEEERYEAVLAATPLQEER